MDDLMSACCHLARRARCKRRHFLILQAQIRCGRCSGGGHLIPGGLVETSRCRGWLRTLIRSHARTVSRCCIVTESDTSWPYAGIYHPGWVLLLFNCRTCKLYLSECIISVVRTLELTLPACAGEAILADYSHVSE